MPPCPRTTTRGVIEQRTRLDIRYWRRKGWLQPRTAGSLSWSNGSSVRYAVHDDHVALAYCVNAGDERREVNITIPVRRTPCRYGGERAYWLCPNCYRRREVVVMANTGLFWGCRTCLRLRYISQGLAPHHRMQRRAELLYDRAGDEHEDGTIYKRTRVRWATFNRLMDKANAISQQADNEWVNHMARLFARLGVKPDDVF